MCIREHSRVQPEVISLKETTTNQGKTTMNDNEIEELIAANDDHPAQHWANAEDPLPEVVNG